MAVQQEVAARTGQLPAAVTESEPVSRRGVRWQEIALAALTLLYFLFALFPVIWMIILSLKPQDKLFTTYFQFQPTLAAYEEAFPWAQHRPASSHRAPCRRRRDPGSCLHHAPRH